MDVKNISEGCEDFTGNVWLLENNEKVLVDVGQGDSWNEIKKIDEVDKVVITHSHSDHVENLKNVQDKFNPKVYALEPSNLQFEATELDEGQKIELCGLYFEIIHTPGHKNDSICLYNPENNILFTGDLIFPEGGFGRTDLTEGDREQLIKSIKKIIELDVERFYPGHEDAVTQKADHWISKSLENAAKREPKY